MEIKDYRGKGKGQYSEDFHNLLSIIDDNDLGSMLTQLVNRKHQSTVYNLLKIREIGNLSNGVYRNLFYSVCEAGWIDVIDLLIEKGINIHSDNDKAIFRALNANDIKLIKYLESLGLSLKNGLEEAMVRAMKNNNKEIMQHIIDTYY